MLEFEDNALIICYKSHIICATICHNVFRIFIRYVIYWSLRSNGCKKYSHVGRRRCLGMERQKFLKIGMMMLIAAVIAVSPTSTIGTSFFERANAQAMCSDDNNTSPSPKSPNALPVILIHGYNEPPTVWTHWQHRLDADGIRYCTVSFSDDECGSALDHSQRE